MPRPQFSIRTLLWLTLVVAAFLGGIGVERERQRRENAESALIPPPSIDPFDGSRPVVQPPVAPRN